MLEVIRIYTIFTFFIYIILCSIVYMLCRDFLDKINEKKVENLNKTFGVEVQRQIETIKLNNKLYKMDIDYIKSKIRSKNYLEVFNETIIKLNKDKINKEYTKIYVKYFEEDILKIVRKYKNKDDIEKTFIVNLLGEYRLDSYELNEFLFNCLNTKSIFLRVETLKTFSKIGKITNLIKALQCISDEKQYINGKILIDILDNFYGNFETLDKALLFKFYTFNNQIQKNIIEHLKNQNAEFAKDQVMSILTDENLNKEVRISAIKYFSKIHFNYAKEEIKKLLNHKEWEYRAISASTLGKYKEKEIIEALLISITDYNWYVRYNSAISLLNFNEDIIIDRVIKTNDKYSIDILLYAMFSQEKICYEDYLKETGKLEVDYSC